MERIEVLKGSVLTVQEVSSYLRVHPSTIYRMLKRNQLPAFRVGSDWRFTVEAIDQFQVETSGTAVMYNGQGASNYVVKSGTNTFRGSKSRSHTTLTSRSSLPAGQPRSAAVRRPSHRARMAPCDALRSRPCPSTTK